MIVYYLHKKFPIWHNLNLINTLSFNVGHPRHFDVNENYVNKLLLIDKQDLKLIPRSNLTTKNIFLCISDSLNPEMTIQKYPLIFINSNISKESIYNYLQGIFDLFEDWDNSLKEICYEERGFSELIESCDKVLSHPISLIDSEFSYVAYSKELSERRGLTKKFVDENNKIPLESVSEMISQPSYHELENLKEVFEFIAGEHILCKNIFDENDNYIGRLIINAPDDIKYITAIFNHLAYYIEELYHKFGSFHIHAVQSNKWHHLLYGGLNQDHIADDFIQRLVIESNFSIYDEYMLIQFFSNHRYDKTLHSQYLCPQLEQLWPGSCCVPYESCLVFLINITAYTKYTKQDFYQKLAYFLRENLLSASISRKFTNLKQIAAAYSQTKIAIEIGTKKHPMFWYYRFDDYTYDYIILQISKDFLPNQICFHGLLNLKEHDQKSGTQYYQTLLTYCQMQYNSSAAAKALYIHRSTFLGRMERIKEIAQINLDNWEELLYILISFQLLES